jgi:two-component system, NtrC family, response regulator AtoC
MKTQGDVPMTARLAIVDDDPAFTEFLRIFLQTRDYVVSVYESGTAFLDGITKGDAPPHVVLLDVGMPDPDGIETLRMLRNTHPTVQAIMLSGRQTPATIVEAIRLGAADYVLKPGDPGGIGEAALEAAIRNALERQSLAAEVARLGAQAAEDPEGAQICWTSSSSAMAPIMTMVERVADSDVGVLLRGESGVGKEVVAREVHRRSPRRTRPFVKVNCAALPADLLESELFGHERGAFTGAGVTRIGKFEFASGGTLMLDEIGEMPAALQAKLLHVLQDASFTRLGSNRPVDVDVRVIAATNRDLEAMMQVGTFREDLYYRLQVIEIRVPPLRERREEIAPLADFFRVKYARLYRRPSVRISRRMLDALVEYSWPGNIRELENMMKRFVVLQDESLVMSELSRSQSFVRPPNGPTPAPRPQPVDNPNPVRETDSTQAFDRTRHEHFAETASSPVAVDLADSEGEEDVEVEVEELPGEEGVDLQALAKRASLRAERAAIDDALSRFRWNRRKAAAYLRVSYKTLLNKMKECGITDSAAS